MKRGSIPDSALLTAARHLRAMAPVTLAALLSLATSAMLILPPALASDEMTGENVTVMRGHPIQDDLAAAGSMVDIGDRVEGDVTAAGANVLLRGPITGDVLAAGGTVHCRASVGDDLRAVGGNVIVTGPVAGNALIGGGTIALLEGARVGRDAVLGGGQISVQAPIAGDLRLAAQSATLASPIKGSVVARVDRLTLLPGTLIEGDLDVYSPQIPQVAPGARIEGAVRHHPTPAVAAAGRPEQRTSLWQTFVGWLALCAAKFVSLLLLCTVGLKLFPASIAGIEHTLVRRSGASLAAGFLGLTLVPVAAGVMALTLVGLPLAVLVMSAYVAALISANVFLAHRVGAWLAHRARPAHKHQEPGVDTAPSSATTRIVTGVLAVSLLTSLPAIGWAFQFAFLLLGIGALLIYIRDETRTRHHTNTSAG